MREPLATVNVAALGRIAVDCGELWTLRKGDGIASCRLVKHPKGGEARPDDRRRLVSREHRRWRADAVRGRS